MKRLRVKGGNHRGFLLLEVMVAVMVLALGVVALGRCVQNCLAADQLKEESARARRALENAMMMVEAGTVPAVESKSEELKGMFAGMTLKTTRTLLKEKNEKDQEVAGIYAVTLEVLWTSRAQKQSRRLTFYNYPRPR
ncbi:MAG: hypothetical protein JWL59_1042 [Chthoniobacteraceae bacterium]|nr:hypothetical protein [Chthoniobacteraceae bacterium]